MSSAAKDAAWFTFLVVAAVAAVFGLRIGAERVGHCLYVHFGYYAEAAFAWSLILLLIFLLFFILSKAFE